MGSRRLIRLGGSAESLLTKSCRWVLIRTHYTTSAILSTKAPKYDIKHAEMRTPSGWSPPTGLPAPPGTEPTLPFRVPRSKFRNLPVYTDYKNGRNQILTKISHIDGNVVVMEKMLRDHLNVINLRSRADTLTGSIVLHGNHRDRVIRWLKRMGF